MTAKNELKDWKNANTFNDLCILMQRALKGEGLESFVSFTCEETGCVLVEESMPYQDDLIKLNQLGFLTIDSQPGTQEFKKINDITDVVTEFNKKEKFIKEYIKEKELKPNDLIELYEQREYIEGFMTKDTLLKILPKLHCYIVCVQPANCKKSRIKVRDNYEHKLKQKLTYIYIPDHFDKTWPMSSYYATFNPKLSLIYYLINLSRYTYDFKRDIISKYQKNKKDFYDRKTKGNEDKNKAENGNETKDEKTLINSFLNDISEGYVWSENCINYDYNLMYLPTNKQMEDQYDFNKDKDYFFGDFKKELVEWMEQNTYWVTIISPEYDDNYLTRLLIELLSAKNDWKDANTFDDLCTLMQQALKGNLESFAMNGLGTDFLADESMPYRDDFIKLNQLGFLTIDSQPCTVKIEKVNNATDIASYVKKNIEKGEYKLDDFVQLYEQREYVRGFMTKETLLKILPKLNYYIVCIEPADNQPKLKIRNNYEDKLESNITYIYLPEYYQEEMPKSSIFPVTDPKTGLDIYLINGSRYTCDFKKDVIARYTHNRKSKDLKEGDETNEEKLTDACFKLISEDHSFTNDFVNYDIKFMHLLSFTHLKDKNTFDKKFYFRHFKPELVKWMEQNTYLVTIIRPEYGKTGLIDLLIELLS